MQFVQRTMMGGSGKTVWVRRLEHTVLRIVSLAFSLASAHAIRWFFAPLDGIDGLQPIITWVVALGFGLLGYFVSRGLAHRLMNHERIRAYAPICLIVEVVEIFCNYALAAAVIQRASWLSAVPGAQRSFLTDATYVVLSIIPLVSLLLAVVDMDMERSKNGTLSGGGFPSLTGNRFGKQAASPKVPTYTPSASAGTMSVPYPTPGTSSNGYAAGLPPMNSSRGSASPFAPVGAAARPTSLLDSSGIP
ncbi:MAG TPA: hypothetical protein VGT44_10375 [Ktedonobacteraceae bacterium]|nr:hypothetical protein [Ktedonobacteraceae bacterium]